MLYTAIIEDAIDGEELSPEEAALRIWENLRTVSPIMVLVDENGHRQEIDLGQVSRADELSAIDDLIDWFDTTGRRPYVEASSADQR